MQNLKLSEEEWERLKQINGDIRQMMNELPAAVHAMMKQLQPTLADIALLMRNLQHPPVHGYDCSKERREKRMRRQLTRLQTKSSIPYYRQYEKTIRQKS